MPALNFKARFASDVETGRKRQTIRRKRKHPIVPGDMLYLYTGMRTKHCRKLGESECMDVEPIMIHGTRVFLGGRLLNHDELWRLATDDGFYGNPQQFLLFFWEEYGKGIFEGDVIRW